MKKQKKKIQKKCVIWIIIIGLVLLLALSYFSSEEGEGFGLFSKKFWARPQCSDSADNDGDGLCDYAGCKIRNVELQADPDCSSLEDDSESPGEMSAEDEGCTDSDGGKYYYTQGSVYSEVGPYAPESGEDSCLNENLQYTETNGVHLREVFCNIQDMHESDVVLCLYGCEYGRCLGSPSQQCEDSDNGIDASVQGYVYNSLDPSSPKIYDSCFVNAFGRGEQDVKEVYCNVDGMFDMQFVECPENCVDGVCVEGLVFPAGLVSWWKFDDDFSDAVTDDEEGNNPGTIVGAGQIPDAERGLVASFDGTNYIDIVDNTGIASLPLTGDWAVSGWFKCGGIGADRTVFAIQGLNLDDINLYGCWNAGSLINLYWRDVGGNHLSSTASDTDWHHVVITSTASNSHHMYIDGVYDLSFSDDVSASRGFSGMQIGAREGGERFVGEVDDVMVFNRGLTEDEILWIYGFGMQCNTVDDCSNNTACHTLVDCDPVGTGYDFVDDRGCAYEFLPSGTECDDGLFCTDNTVCNSSGNCQGGNLYDCNDSIACTDDVCTEGGSGPVCVNNPNNILCTVFPNLVCDASNDCVECVQESDCGTCQNCIANTCVDITATNGNNCNNRCTECVAGSCNLKSSNEECRSCNECNGIAIDCQPVNASDGTPWNCNSPNECIGGSCCIDSEPDGVCDSDCTKWVEVSGSGIDCSSSNPCALQTAVDEAYSEQDGDVICLRDGYYGEIGPLGTNLNGMRNSDYITIQSDVGHRAGFKAIRLQNVIYWRFNKISISPELEPGYNPINPEGLYRYLFFVYGQDAPVSSTSSHHIILENSDLYYINDSSVWTTPALWEAGTRSADTSVSKAIDLDKEDIQYIIIRNNKIRNVDMGIVPAGDYNLFEYNLIDGISADGMNLNGASHVLIQYNTIQNFYEVDGNHDDGIQFQRGIMTNNIIRGNKIFYKSVDGDHRDYIVSDGPMSIDVTSGVNTGFIIENNIIVSLHDSTCILLNADSNSIIRNNIGLNPFGESNPVPSTDCPIHVSGAGIDVTVTNNIARNIYGDGTFINNFNIDGYNWDDVFVDWRTYDFRPKQGSPLIDAGSDFAPVIDILGVNRPQDGDGSGSAEYDIGPYEIVGLPSLSPFTKLWEWLKDLFT